MYVLYLSQLIMSTITASQARTNWFQLLKNILKGYPPQRISSKHGGLVLMSEEEYESMLETMELLSVPGFKESLDQAEKDIENGDFLTMEEVFGEFMNESDEK